MVDENRPAFHRDKCAMASDRDLAHVVVALLGDGEGPPPGTDDPELEDLEAVPFVTIDNEGSRDLDQALHVARDGDGHCCPRGGSAFFDLDLAGNRLVLTRLRFQPMQPSGRDVEVTAGTLKD